MTLILLNMAHEPAGPMSTTVAGLINCSSTTRSTAKGQHGEGVTAQIDVLEWKRTLMVLLWLWYGARDFQQRTSVSTKRRTTGERHVTDSE